MSSISRSEDQPSTLVLNSNQSTAKTIKTTTVNPVQLNSTTSTSQFNFTSFTSVWSGIVSEYNAFLGSAIEFDQTFDELKEKRNLNYSKRLRNESLDEKREVEVTEAIGKRRKREESDIGSKRRQDSKSRSYSRERDLFVVSESNILAEAYEKSTTSSSSTSRAYSRSKVAATLSGSKSLSGKRVVSLLPTAFPSTTTATTNRSLPTHIISQYAQTNLKSAEEGVETILMGETGNELSQVWRKAKEAERKKKDAKRIEELEDQVRALKEQLSKSSTVPLATAALNFLRSPFKSSTGTTRSHSTPPLAPPPPAPPAPPLPTLGSKPNWKRDTRNELLEEARAALKATPKKSMKGRRLSAVGPPTAIDGGGIDMGAFLDEMKGVKLRKVSTEEVQKEKELAQKGKEKDNAEITTMLQRAFQRKLAKTSDSPLPRSQSLHDLSNSSNSPNSQPTWKNIKTSSKRAYQSSSMAYDNSTPTRAMSPPITSFPHQFSTFGNLTPSLNRTRPIPSTSTSTSTSASKFHYGKSISTNITRPISISGGTRLNKKPRRSSLEETDEIESEAPLSPPPTQVPSSSKFQFQPPSKSTTNESTQNNVLPLSTTSSFTSTSTRPLDSRKRHSLQIGETIIKPISPGRKDTGGGGRKKKRFSTLPYTYTASESPEIPLRGGIDCERDREAEEEDGEQEGEEDVEHGDLIGFGIRLPDDDRNCFL